MLNISRIQRSLTLAVSELDDFSNVSSRYPSGVNSTVLYLAKHPDHPIAELVNGRIAEFDRADDDEAVQQAIMERCANDPHYFIESWVWTYDPRRKPSTIPFALFERQKEFIDWLLDRIELSEDGVVEKSRDAGLSWICIAFALWQFLFVPGSKVTFGSRKKELVDSLGQPDSLFEKFRIAVKNLPSWMRPINMSDNEMRFVNRENGSTVTGEAGDNMGRGGRSTLYFLDEFAFVKRADTVDAAVGDNSEVKIYVSTPNGPANSFAKKRHSGNFPVFQIHWKQDPRKWHWELEGVNGTIIQKGTGMGAPAGAKYPWYEKKKRTTDPIKLAQEVDIDYNASIDGICIPHAWVLAALNLPLPEAGVRNAGMDVADGGADDTVFIFRHGPTVKLNNIHTRPEGNTTQTAFWARQLAERYMVETFYFDAIGVGAGVSGTLRTAEMDGELDFTQIPVISGATATDVKWPEFGNRPGPTIFGNVRAELWWRLRCRFERTYEYVNGIAQHPLDTLISIPNDPELIAQLSQPLRRFSTTGRILIESKEDMKARQVDSPDRADALAFAFADIPQKDGIPAWLKNY